MAAAVSADDRKKYAVGPQGSFPIKNRSQARSALRLRGHASPALRRKIIRVAARYLPKAAAKAREEDKKRGKS